MVTDSLPESLAREGDLMLNAVVTELLQLPAIELVTFRDSRLPGPQWVNSIELVVIESQEAFNRSWNNLTRSCDAIWPIAPETGGILEILCKDVEKQGKILLNSSSEAVRQTTSKHNTLTILAKHGIPVVPTYRLPVFHSELDPPWVVKPDDGVGCEGIRIVSDSDELDSCYSGMENDNLVIQPFICGESKSLSVLFNQGYALILTCNRQYISHSDGLISLTGCEVNAVQDVDGRFDLLVKQIAKALPGLWGYAGVDLIGTKDDVLVLEVNPRLTTSYAGLGEALEINTAELILNLLEDNGNSTAVKNPNTRYESVFISLEQSP